MRHTLITIAFFVLLVVAWHFACLPGEDPAPMLFPTPDAVWDYIWKATMNATLPDAVWVTIKRLLYGYSVGLLIGIPIGMIMARFRIVYDTVGVLALGFQALPSVCWVPLACLWFGQTETAMLFVVIMGTVWSVILSTDNGMRNIPPIYARAARTMGSGSFHTLVFVSLPAAAPFVVSGMKQGWAFAWRSLMAAEIYVSITTGFGLGQLLHYGRELNSMDQVIGVMITIIVIGLLADKIMFSPAERFLHRRWGTGRDTR